MGSAASSNPNEIKEMKENEKKLNALIANVYSSLQSFAHPERCQFIKEAEGVSYGWELEPGNYEEAIYELKKQAVLNGANVAQIEQKRMPISLSLSQKLRTKDPISPYFHFHVYGRLFKCP